jgi:cytochrome P450
VTAKGLPSASLVESLQFNQTVIVPNAVQGLFRRRPGAVAIATRLDVEGRAVRLMAGLRRRHGPGPVWIRVMTDRALLMLDVDDVRRVLEGSPQPFASDPEAKRKGMGHFQPHALTLSRGDLWADRRRFTEAVLDTPEPVPRLGDRFVAVAVEETDALLGEIEDEDEGRLAYDDLLRAFRRVVRRIVLGDAAREDEELSDLLAELMSQANGLPSKRSEEYEPFMERIRSYVEAAEPGSLVGLIPEAPSGPDTHVEGQVPHWLFATQDTLSMNALRALAAIASHPEQRAEVEAELAGAGGRDAEPAGADPIFSAAGVAGLPYLRACLHEAMRLWPTTPLLSRETLTELTWNGDVVPAGTQLLIVNTFHHRDPQRVDHADRFAPEAWTEGDAGEDWSFNHFSHGPQGCPGVNLALLVGGAVLARLLTQRRPRLVEPKLDPERPLPHMLDVFKLRFSLEEEAAAG